MVVSTASSKTTKDSTKTKGAAKAVSDQKSAPVSEAQFASIRDVMHQITSGTGANAPGSIQALFTIINGGAASPRQSDIGMEFPVQAAITEALQKGFHIVCFQEGDDKIIASTDPTLLDTSIREFKTSSGELVRDLAVKNLKASANDEAGFTYEQLSSEGVLVDGKPVPGKRFVAYVAGRKAFKFDSEKKFLTLIFAVDSVN